MADNDAVRSLLAPVTPKQYSQPTVEQSVKGWTRCRAGLRRAAFQIAVTPGAQVLCMRDAF
jgi:hypothetical protein